MSKTTRDALDEFHAALEAFGRQIIKTMLPVLDRISRFIINMKCQHAPYLYVKGSNIRTYCSKCGFEL